jgi:hypothetical protein
MGKGKRVVTSISFSFDETKLIAAGLDKNNSVLVFDVHTGETLAESSTGANKILSIA